MSITFVGYETTYNTGTSINALAPATTYDDGGLVAIVLVQYVAGTTQPVISGPVGWTGHMIKACKADGPGSNSSDFTSTNLGQVVQIWTKDSVTSSDGGTNFTFTHDQSSGLMGVWMSSWRVDIGVATYGAATNLTAIQKWDNTGFGNVGNIQTPATASDTPDECHIVFACPILVTNDREFIWKDTWTTTPAGKICDDGPGNSNHLFAVWYQTIPAFWAVDGDDYNVHDPDFIDNTAPGGMVYGTFRVQRTVPGTGEDTVSDDVTVAYQVTAGDPIIGTLTDTVSFDPDVSYLVGMFVTEGVELTPATVEQQVITVAEAIGLSPTAASNLAALIAEALMLDADHAPSTIYGRTLNEIVQLLDAARTADAVTLPETIGIAPLAQALTAALVLEQLGLQLTSTPSTIFGRSLADTAAFTDSLRNFFAGSISETAGFATAVLNPLRMVDTVSESAGISPTLAEQLVFRVLVEEDIDFEFADVASMIFSGQVTDGVEISAAYLQPGSTFTTWAVNTSNGAVTEYTNYGFNSFAQMGRKYVAASSAGIYELLGDDDAGADIIADIKTGFAQFAGSRFTMFKAAYLGVRGGGTYYLKLEEGDGTTRTYTVISEDMATTKINLGKGLRARYFSFELISAGQDFDLDTIEFVPMWVNRRV